MKKVFVKNSQGTTLLELMIGLLLTAIIINSAYQLYRYVTMSASREKVKAELQQEIINVCNIVEKDIRMAGCSIPGNGIDITFTPQETLFIFTNSERFKTTLAVIAQPAHDKIIVTNDSGFSAEKWIFIPQGTSFIKRRIVSVKTNLTGNDTILLSQPLGIGPLNVGTEIFPADRIAYTFVKNGNNLVFVKIKNSLNFTIGTKIDSLRIVPKDSNGNIVSGSNLETVALLTVVIGGHVGSGSNRVFLAESTEVNIRNFN